MDIHIINAYMYIYIYNILNEIASNSNHSNNDNNNNDNDNTYERKDKITKEKNIIMMIYSSIP